jgi:hypothetical protein
MSLKDVKIRSMATALPADVEAFIEEATRRIDLYFASQSKKLRVPRFVVSDAREAYRVLRAVREEHLALGHKFCEWGSGFGVITSLASMLGFDACGIEIEESLVDHARQLAADFHLDSRFVCGSYIPEEYDYSSDDIGNTVALSESTPLPSELARGVRVFDDDAIEECDVIYVFPWPGEAELVEELFDSRAAAGALLVTYDQQDGVIVQRRVV